MVLASVREEFPYWIKAAASRPRAPCGIPPAAPVLAPLRAVLAVVCRSGATAQHQGLDEWSGRHDRSLLRHAWSIGDRDVRQLPAE